MSSWMHSTLRGILSKVFFTAVCFRCDLGGNLLSSITATKNVLLTSLVLQTLWKIAGIFEEMYSIRELEMTAQLICTRRALQSHSKFQNIHSNNRITNCDSQLSLMLLLKS